MQGLRVGNVMAMVVLVFASNAHAEDVHHKIAVMGATAGGYQYQNGIFCQAPADLLSEFKKRMAVKYAKSGEDFEPAFAEGREQASQWMKHMLSLGKDVSVGEANLRQSMCVDGHLVEHMREKLIKP